MLKNKKRTKNLRIINSSPVKTRSKSNPNNLSSAQNNNSQINMAEAKLEAILQHLPCFDGKKETNINFFLSQWETLAKDSQLKQEVKLILLKAKFSGTARDTIINSKELNEESDYKTFIEKIKKEFQPKLTFEDVQNSFLTLKQNASQTMEDFIKAFNMAATKYIEKSGHSKEIGAVNFLQKVKLTRFLEAIRPDIALEIRKQAPESYEEAVNMAQKIESAFNAIPKESLNYVDSTHQENMKETFENISKNYKDEISKLRAELAELKINNTEKQTKKIKCEICEKTNHTTKQCFFNGKNKNQNRQKTRNKTINTPTYPNNQNFPPAMPYYPYHQNVYPQAGANYGNHGYMNNHNFPYYAPNMPHYNMPDNNYAHRQNPAAFAQNPPGQSNYATKKPQHNNYNNRNNFKPRFNKKSNKKSAENE